MVDSDPNVFYKYTSVFFDNSRPGTQELVRNNFLPLKPVQCYLGYAYFAHQLLSVLYILANKAHNIEGMSHSHGGDFEFKLN